MREYSDIFRRYYDSEDGQLVTIPKQAAKYIRHSCPLLDLYVVDDTVVFVFDKAASKPLYELWNKRKLV